MLLNEILGFGETKSRHEKLLNLVQKGHHHAQELGNDWLNTIIKVSRNSLREQITDMIRDARVKFNQLMAKNDFRNAAQYLNWITVLYNKEMEDANVASDKEIRAKYDNDDYEVYPPYEK